MNKIFKSIWNHVTRTFTAVSEIQQTNGKKAKKRFNEGCHSQFVNNDGWCESGLFQGRRYLA